MSKKTDEQLTKIMKEFAGGLSGTIDNQLEFSKLLDRIIGLIEFLMRSVTVIFFILSLLVWRVFLWTPFSKLLDSIGETWTSLSEGYQILILGFIGTIIAGIIAHVGGSLLLAKIKNVLKS